MSLKSIALPAAIAAVAIAAYLPAFNAGFIWDDDWLVTSNPLMRDVEGLRQIWTYQKEDTPDYFPVTWTAFWLEYHLWGPNFAAGYHATNILLHAAGAILVYFALRRLAVPGAFLAAMIFAVHPVNVASVAWISEQKNTLSLIFYLLSILCFLKHDGGEGRKWSWYGLSLGMFALGLLSKTSVIMLPVVLLLLAWWRRNRVTLTDWLKAAPFFALSLAAAVMTIYSQTTVVIKEEIVRGPNENFFFRLAVAGQAVWFYLYKALLPINLAMTYPRWTIYPKSLIAYLPLLALVGVFVLLWLFRTGWRRPVLFALSYFVVTLFPVLGFFTMYFLMYAFVADHWQYVSIISIIALVVAGAYSLSRYVPKTVLRAAAVIVVAVLAILTWRQASIYKDQETLWRDNINKYPTAWMAHFNLGSALEGKGQLDEAMKCYQEAMRLKSDADKPYINIGSMLAKQGKMKEAITYFVRAIQVNPQSHVAYSNYGAMLHALGRSQEGLMQLHRSLELCPDYFDAHSNMAAILAAVGDLNGALPHARKAVEIRPEETVPRILLADILVKTGKPDEAVQQYRRVIQSDPNSAEVYLKLGIVLTSMNRSAEAIDAFRQVVALQPNNADGWNNLGILYAQSGRTDRAITAFEKALQIQSDNLDFHQNIAVALVQMDRTRQAVPHYRFIVERKGDWLDPLASLAFLLATAKEDDIRNGKEAMQLAQKACQLDPNSPEAFDALAAAYAEAGNFMQASSIATKAAEMAQATGKGRLADVIRSRQKIYSTGKPFRQ